MLWALDDSLVSGMVLYSLQASQKARFSSLNSEPRNRWNACTPAERARVGQGQRTYGVNMLLVKLRTSVITVYSK